MNEDLQGAFSLIKNVCEAANLNYDGHVRVQGALRIVVDAVNAGLEEEVEAPMSEEAIAEEQASYPNGEGQVL